MTAQPPFSTDPDVASGLPDPDHQGEFYDDVPLKRFFAWLVDFALVLALSLLVLPFTAFTGLFFFPFLMLTVSFGYRAITLAGGSATLGMRLMAIELRDRHGDRFDATLAVLHTAAYLFMMSAFVLQAASILAMLMGQRAQGLHDLLLGTAAINRMRAV